MQQQPRRTTHHTSPCAIVSEESSSLITCTIELDLYSTRVAESNEEQNQQHNSKKMRSTFLLLVVVVVATTQAFSPHASLGRSMSTTTATTHTSTKTRLFMIDPSLISGMLPMDVGIAAVSAAAGALSQVPKIQQLERELDVTRAALTDSEQQLVSKIHELEEKLFTMDNEYEQQTSKFKKQYDRQMRDDLERITDKMKVDFGYKMEIRVEEAKSKLLSEKLQEVSSRGGDKQAELVTLRLQRSRVEDANGTLEKALQDSQIELQRLQDASSKKASWWPFS